MKHHYFLTILTTLLLFSCEKNNVKTIPTLSENGFYNLVVEIPAGTNKKYEFDTDLMEFEIDQRDGKDRVIPFLPYFGNYGFIPSTLSDKSKGGDGDPLDMFVICETLPQGTVIETIPIGTIKLIDNEEEDYKIIAVPADNQLNVLGIRDFESLKKEYPAVISIIELWLKNYDSDRLKIQGWLNQKETIDYIEKNRNI